MKSFMRTVYSSSLVVLVSILQSAAQVRGEVTVLDQIKNDGISNNEGHQLCLQAIDYEGCIKTQTGSGDIPIVIESPHGYKPKTVQHIVLGGRNLRYIRYIGRTRDIFGGRVLPNLGNYMQREFVYRLDCKDKTFDRIGDKRSATMIKGIGWKPITDDPSAMKVFSVYCPTIDQLETYRSEDTAN